MGGVVLMMLLLPCNLEDRQSNVTVSTHKLFTHTRFLNIADDFKRF